MDITKSQSDFESWLKSKMPTTYKLAYETENYCDDEDMVNLAKASVLDMRTAWQAARESIEIELPTAINAGEIGPAISKERIMARLAYAGIRIKGESE
ncbi:hypothetical protein B7R70_07720 [Yersinia pseudotuberculosis]|nr:hypothetical protein [Yersinia pseudotuberculosis]PSH17669.1 hypothetical protein BLA52_13235 [Yersinia pseudotuberculosis]PSH27846.1 hypothetical protein BLA50_03410 [Yersinia pseudotuberculosis]PSH33467.1 hypothetical protein BA197_15600 [Yersinia pseudotuberculosis]PST80118.1 hypothetical protein B7R70_07720 [Yersinia pseudotuberculosis]